MSSTRAIPLFYWSSKIFERKTEENYGDLLSLFIVEQVSGRKVRFYNAPKRRKSWFKSKHILAIGSIMTYATEKSHIWGSGIISRNDTFKGGRFHAVRGPETRNRVMELGFDCPEVYGDPALLLPKFTDEKVEKKYELGVIPHYVDFEKASDIFGDNPKIKVIKLLNNDHKTVTREILSCNRTISSSLHGIIVSHAFAIPSIWVKFSDKLTGDNVKFTDYFLSVGITPYDGISIGEDVTEMTINSIIEKATNLPEPDSIIEVQNKLIAAFPKEI